MTMMSDEVGQRHEEKQGWHSKYHNDLSTHTGTQAAYEEVCGSTATLLFFFVFIFYVLDKFTRGLGPP